MAMTTLPEKTANSCCRQTSGDPACRQEDQSGFPHPNTANALGTEKSASEWREGMRAQRVSVGDMCKEARKAQPWRHDKKLTTVSP